jgi:hypothetical protein
VLVYILATRAVALHLLFVMNLVGGSESLNQILARLNPLVLFGVLCREGTRQCLDETGVVGVTEVSTAS